MHIIVHTNVFKLVGLIQWSETYWLVFWLITDYAKNKKLFEEENKREKKN